MLEEDQNQQDGDADELLRRALLDDSSSVAVSLRVDGLPLSEAVTVIFHARRDLGTLQTYVTCGSRGAGATVAAERAVAGPLRPRPRRGRGPRGGRAAVRRAGDDASRRAGWRRHRARRLARAAEAMIGSSVAVDNSVQLSVRLPAHRLLPTALVARDSQLIVTPGVQRAHAGRGPAAARDRVRPAGLQPGLSARRRSGAVRGGVLRRSPPITRGRSPRASTTRRPRSSGSWS